AIVVPTMGAVLGLASPGYADSPSSQGWWNAANQGLAQPPDPPDVPSDGLLLQGGLSAPSAYAALAFTLPPETTAASLTLDVASTATQATSVQACPAKPGWKPAQGGPMADAPPYDCARSVAAVLTADGKHLVFRDVSGLATIDGALSLALVPGDSDRVALAKPDASALAVQQAGPPVVAAPPPAVTPANGSIAVGSGLPAAAPVQPAGPLLPAQAGSAAAPAPAVAAPRSSTATTFGRQQAAPVQEAAHETTTGVRVVLAVEALLTLISFGLLGVGPARGLVRLTGVGTIRGDRPRGVGRFSRERVGSAPSL
ncbi:MAG: hypothetical protein JWO88_2590, partial [Frankiales bacterium]|nr:hypothetical protein [Frankiales bacterium]